MSCTHIWVQEGFYAALHLAWTRILFLHEIIIKVSPKIYLERTENLNLLPFISAT